MMEKGFKKVFLILGGAAIVFTATISFKKNCYCSELIIGGDGKIEGTIDRGEVSDNEDFYEEVNPVVETPVVETPEVKEPVVETPEVLPGDSPEKQKKQKVTDVINVVTDYITETITTETEVSAPAPVPVYTYGVKKFEEKALADVEEELLNAPEIKEVQTWDAGMSAVLAVIAGFAGITILKIKIK